ncbi:MULTISPECIES: DUF4097 family beta strand repeat-containing protein [unclassified Clostridioides]|uniref:DUF4097 family beta strand repeat-containing protein n=1 Tax=unclassified Clostridioides TaxID=2635829 RepID=UPI001D0F61A0|nr:DUF4097 family beta strand repeat protein [Clostridioides sp. ES-S-0049-03]MCC0675859.1 DUF4097 family beta strand repeat protein [Clostridioides sp. ES-W-0018-02]MCC0711061.1 DUF4097 family beta strand repeat protein [Clostridioides sp. ES-W-0017-02]UDN57935.1 DUF4097 family beta strand repeat protein [Clostridioides sp. ES-S-0010-02]
MNKKFLKIKIIVWSIVAIVFSIIFIIFLTNTITSSKYDVKDLIKGSVKNESFLSSNKNYDKYITVKSESFSNKINNIDVDWISGEVRVLKSDSNKIKLIQKAPSNFSRKKIAKIKVDGNTLSIIDNSAKKFFIGIGLPKSTVLELYLPEKLYNNINVSTTSADIYSTYLKSNMAYIESVSGNIEMYGKIDKMTLETTSSNINIKKLDSKSVTCNSVSGKIQLSGKTDDLKINTTSGDIDLENMDNKNLICESTSGKVNIEGKFSNIKSETTSGDIKINSSAMLSSFKCDTTSGDIDLYIPENSGFTLDFSKVSGNLNSSFKLLQDGDSYVYKNGTAKMYVDTTSADLNIIKNN